MPTAIVVMKNGRVAMDGSVRQVITEASIEASIGLPVQVHELDDRMTGLFRR